MKESIKKEIMDLAAQSLTVNSPIRYGQAVFNAAYHLYPVYANMLRTTKYDPFYEDSRVNAFIEELLKLIKE